MRNDSRIRKLEEKAKPPKGIIFESSILRELQAGTRIVTGDFSLEEIQKKVSRKR